MNDVVQAGYHGLGDPCGREAVAPSIRAALLLALRLLLFLAVRGSQVEQKRVMLIVLLCFLPPRLRLSLVVQQQVRVVVAATVRHHHRPDGAGVDVLDLEKTLHDVYVLRLDILGDIKNKQTNEDEVRNWCFWGRGVFSKKKISTSSGKLTWKALLSQSTEQDVMLPIQCRFPEIRCVSFSQQPNTSYGLFLTRDSSV